MTSDPNYERRLLIQSALGEPSTAISAWTEWRKTFEGPESSSALYWAGGYIYKNLLASGVSDDLVKGLYRHNWTKNSRTRARTLPVMAKLAKDFDGTLIKSFGFTHSGYSHGFRPIADVDVYVNEANLADAAQLLIEHGYSPLLGVSVSTLTNKIALQRGSWNFKLGDGTDIDLHWKLFDHLSAKANDDLIAKHSSYIEMEFGNCRVLSTELSVAYQMHTFALQGEKRFNGLFDTYAIAGSADTRITMDLIESIGLIDAAYSVTDELISSLGIPAEHPIQLLHKEVIQVSRVDSGTDVQRERLARVDKSVLRFPRLYSWWYLHGQPRWFEVLHQALLGCMNRASAGFYSGSFPIVHTFSDANQMPIGFHCQYPATQYRWTHRGDARVRFNLNTKINWHPFREKQIEVEVTLDDVNWKISPTQKVVVYANGKRVGSFTKSKTVLAFKRRTRRSSFEMSFRTTDAPSPLESSMHSNWHQMLMPIHSVKLNDVEK
jgi:hypothetical protein